MIKHSDISVFVENPGLLKSADLVQLSDLVKNYPYFQTAHILLLKALKENKSENFQTQLGKSSVFISDRDLLFKFLNQEFKCIEKQDETKNEQNKKDEQPKTKEESNLLKNKNVKRKIVDSAEGMGANISETISSQIVFSSLKKDDKLEYPPEIYFIEEERDGKNHMITIDAKPDNPKKKKDILDIDEEQINAEDEEKKPSEAPSEPFELIESEDVEQETTEKQKSNKSEHFDINNYADDNVLEVKDDLITQFIEKNPRLKAKEVKEDETIDISEDSIKENPDLLSETLIKVYIKQGLFQKAIESYQKLSLKYPEKSAYFASQIKILEDKLNK